jgi:hypothetical protein
LEKERSYNETGHSMRSWATNRQYTRVHKVGLSHTTTDMILISFFLVF